MTILAYIFYNVIIPQSISPNKTCNVSVAVVLYTVIVILYIAKVWYL